MELGRKVDLAFKWIRSACCYHNFDHNLYPLSSKFEAIGMGIVRAGGFVGLDARWSVKTEGFVDPDKFGSRYLLTLRPNLYIDIPASSLYINTFFQIVRYSHDVFEEKVAPQTYPQTFCGSHPLAMEYALFFA